MPDLFSHLPPEIVTDVVNYISQDDCIECMQVCHRWHQTIPNHSQHLWQQLTIEKPWFDFEPVIHDLWGTKTNDCLMKCLPHVQEVSIKGFVPNLILKTLANLTCTITFLEIDMHPYHTDNNGTGFLIDVVSRFKDTLMELVVDEFPHDIALKSLLKSVPNLTHLTFHFAHFNGPNTGQNYYENSGYIFENDNDNNNDFRTNIVYLNMEVPPSNFQQGFDIVLSTCPKLRALVVPNVYNVSGRTVVNCNLLDSRLPLLRYLLWGVLTGQVATTHSETLNRWKAASKSSEYDAEVGTLREFIHWSNRHENGSIIPLIKRSQQQLVHAQLRPDPVTESLQTQELQRLQLRQLKKLVLDLFSDYDNDAAWINFVKACGRLESLEVIKAADHILLYNIVDALRAPEHLRILRLEGCHRCETPSTSIGRIVRKFSTLQHLDLSGVCVYDQDLLDICSMEALQSLTITMKHHESQLSLKGLLEATKVLQEAKEPKLESLELARVDNLTDTVLQRFGQLKSLSKISIGHNKQITEEGVLTFLNLPKSGSRSLQIHNCEQVSKELIERLGLTDVDKLPVDIFDTI